MNTSLQLVNGLESGKMSEETLVIKRKVSNRFIIAKIVILISLLTESALATSPIKQKTSDKIKDEANSVTIRRTIEGVPIIYAKTTYNLFYGFGYAIAQDRLFQLESAKRTGLGTVAEVFGKDYLAYDKQIRTHYNPQAIKTAITQLSPSDRDIFKGYAAGINAWIAEVNTKPEQWMPKQFKDYGFKPSVWSEYDTVMLFVGSMIYRYGDFNSELQNLELLEALIVQHGAKKGQALFDILLPMQSEKSITTVPSGEWSAKGREDFAQSMYEKMQKVVTKGAQREIKKSANQPLEPSYFVTLSAGDATRNSLVDFHTPKDYIYPDYAPTSFSNIFLLRGDRLQSDKEIGKEQVKTPQSLLLNGPQFGFFTPSYNYAFGLRGAGFHSSGNSPVGYPFTQFGHNQNIAWGSTWGAGDNIDIFELKLNPDNQNQYRYQGKYHDFVITDEIINIKGDTSQTVRRYDSVYGPVVLYRTRDGEKEGVAYAKHRGWRGKEVSTLMSWIRLSQAKNFSQWQTQAAQSAINVNLYYADQAGNIAYALGGHYPLRAQGADGRLPSKGDGSQDWLAFYPFSTNPQVKNPKQNFIANWNNKPADDFPNSDIWWFNWGHTGRIQSLENAITSKPKGYLSAQNAMRIIEETAFVDPSAVALLPTLLQAGKSNKQQSPDLQQGLAILNQWDYQRLDQDSNGVYDNPAATLFKVWLGLYLEKVYTPLIPIKQRSWFTSTGYGNNKSYNLSPGSKILARLTENSQWVANSNKLQLQALTVAVQQLTQQYGSDPVTWKTDVDVIEFNVKNFAGIPQASVDELKRTAIAHNRGTENNWVVFYQDRMGKGSVESGEVLAPGQSAFVAENGSPSPYYGNQLSLFESFKTNQIYFSEDSIEANTIGQATITLVPDGRSD